MKIIRYQIQLIVIIVLTMFISSPVLGETRTVLRAVTVPKRKTAETILSRMAKETPLALGARGIAEVRTFSPEQAKRLPPPVRAAVVDLPLRGHTRIISGSRGYSIYQLTTFDFYRQARELYKRGLKTKALHKVERDLILNPDHANGLALIGSIYEDRRQSRRAAEAYQQLIGFHPGSAMGYRLIGRVYESEKRWNLAAENFEKSLKRGPKQPDVMKNLALLYTLRLGKPQRGLSLVEKALEFKPGTPEYLLGLAEIQRKLGRVKEARKTEEKAARLAPGHRRPAGPGRLESAKLSKTAKSGIGPAPPKADGQTRPRKGEPPGPWPSRTEKSNNRPVRNSTDGWPPPPKGPRETSPSSPSLAGAAERNGGLDGKNPETSNRPASLGSGLFVLNPSMKEKVWKTPRAAAEALRHVRGQGGRGAAFAKVVTPRARIKVLDGTGDLSNALRVQNFLRSKGIDAERPSVKGSGQWKRTVLYFKKGFERQADRVAAVLPEKPQTRPLTWKSPFDIILVVGRQASVQ